MSENETMIEVDGLTKRYGSVLAVDGLSFNVGKGEILGLLGTNGAGKTTTMRMLTCFTPPTAGVARVGGYDVATQSQEVRGLLGYLPEHAPLYLDMSVRAYLRFMAEIKRCPRGQVRSQVDHVIDECNLGNVAKRVIGNLSKGYRQRVGLAQALLGDPKVLILDEPTVGLDPQQISEIRELIKAMAGRRTVILSTHILPEVSMTCQRVIIIHNGKVEAQGTPQKLVDSYDGVTLLHLQVRGEREGIEKILASEPGIARFHCEHEDAGTPPLSTWRMETRLGEDPRGAISAALISAGHELLELHAEGMTLEEIFIRVISRPGEAA